jgi:hypothetical protein
VAAAEARQGEHRQGAARQPAEVAPDGDAEPREREREHEVQHDDPHHAAAEHRRSLPLGDECRAEEAEDRTRRADRDRVG